MKKFRIIAIAALLALLLPGIVIAQEPLGNELLGFNDSEITIDQVTRNILNQPTDFDPNELLLKQSGNSNTAILSQHGQDVNLYVLQYALCGDGNYVNVTQDGSNLHSGIFQAGSSNKIELDMIGSSMVVGIGQKGWDNTVDLDLTGDHMYYGILQLGRGHNISHSNKGGSEIGFGFQSDLIPIKITQTGMGAKLIIR